MEDLCISTYFLDEIDPGTAKTALAPYPAFNIQNINFKANAHPFARLRQIVGHALENKEDAILVLKDAAVDLSGYRPDVFFEAIFNMASLQLYFMAVDTNFTGPLVRISDDLVYLTEIKELKAFVLIRNIFDLILDVDDEVLNEISGAQQNGTLEAILNAILFKKNALFPPLIRDDSPVYKHWFSQAALNDKCIPERINLIVPFRNVKPFLKNCCASILAQDYLNYRVFFVDDCSDDDSVAEIPQQENLIVIRNDSRKYALQNIIAILNHSYFTAEDIIAIMDGDDELAHEYVFSLLNTVYQSEQCLVTYGSFRTMDALISRPFFYTETEFKDLRKSAWKASHLKTFKYKVFQQYLLQDPKGLHLQDPSLEFYKMTYDIALMLPLLEIAGYDKVSYIADRIYNYRLHANNDHIVNRKLQYDIELEIRSKPKFERGIFN